MLILSKKCVYGPFFFEGATVNGEAYLDMLENCLMDQLHEDESEDFIFQQDEALPYWSLTVRQYLNTTLPDRWIGRSGRTGRVLLRWPPRFPDLIPCDFYLWGYKKDWCTYLPLPETWMT